jgi:hypothetical protein
MKSSIRRSAPTVPARPAPGRFFACLLCAFALAGGAAAQPKVELAKSEAVECLTPPPVTQGQPDFPLGAYLRGEVGRVKASLRFEGPQQAPKVEITEKVGSDDFAEAVRMRAAEYRLPCHNGGPKPVIITLDFVFDRDAQRVVTGEPIDAEDASREKTLACRVATGEAIPRYPDRARRYEIQGRVVARVVFTAADQPATVTVLAPKGLELLADAAREWMAEQRLPCMTGAPIRTEIVFIFRLEGDAFGFRPGQSLLSFLKRVKGLAQQSVSVDTQTMNCPFDIRLRYLQPYARNEARQLDRYDSARRRLLDWLETLQLDLKPGEQENAVFGDTLALTVPCVKLEWSAKS